MTRKHFNEENNFKYQISVCQYITGEFLAYIQFFANEFYTGFLILMQIHTFHASALAGLAQALNLITEFVSPWYLN